MSYRHTQKVPTCVLASLGAVGGLASLTAPGLMKSVFCATTAGLVYTFRALTVFIEDDHLNIEFGGWLGLKQMKLSYIESCEVKRLSPLAGWGIHYVGDGWLYNVYGLDAVKVKLKSGKRIYIGTDEPEVLCQAIEDAVAESSATAERESVTA